MLRDLCNEEITINGEKTSIEIRAFKTTRFCYLRAFECYKLLCTL